MFGWRIALDWGLGGVYLGLVCGVFIAEGGIGRRLVFCGCSKGALLGDLDYWDLGSWFRLTLKKIHFFYLFGA